MATRYAIETVFKLIDNITAPLDKVNIKGKAVASALKTEYAAAEASVNAIPGKLANVAKGAAVAGTALLGMGVGVATQQYIEFNQAITKSGSLFKDLDPAAADYAERLAKIEAESRAVAAATEFSATQTANALSSMATAGVASDKALGMLAPTANLATAAGLQLDEAFEKVAGVIGGMKLEMVGDEVTHVSNVMAKTAQSFKTDFNGIAEAAAYAAPQFAALNQPVETLSSAIGILANAGIEGSAAGTALNAALTQLTNDDKLKALESRGIKVKDAFGNMLPLADIVQGLQDKLSGLGNVERNAFLNGIFAVRGAKAMNILMSAGADALREYEGIMYSANGAAEAMAGNMRTSLANQIEVLKSALTELGFKFVETFKEKGGGAIQKITEAVTKFSQDGIQQVADFALKAVSAITTVVEILWKLRYVILAIVAATTTYKALLMAIVIATKAQQVATVAYTLATQGCAAAQALCNTQTAAGRLAILAMAAAQKVAAVATGAWNAAMALLAANPIILIITGIVAAIAALIAIIVLCVKHWDEISAAISKVGEWFKWLGGVVLDGLKASFTSNVNVIKALWSGIVDVFHAVNDAIETALSFVGGIIKEAFLLPIEAVKGYINFLITAWQNLVAAFKSDGIVGALKSIGSSILSFVLTPIEKILGALSKIPGIGGKIAEFKDAVAEVNANFTEQKASPAVAPVTQRDVARVQTYNNNNTNNSNVTIGLEKGLNAKVSGEAPGVTLWRKNTGRF